MRGKGDLGVSAPRNRVDLWGAEGYKGVGLTAYMEAWFRRGVPSFFTSRPCLSGSPPFVCSLRDATVSVYPEVERYPFDFHHQDRGRVNVLRIK